MSWWEEKRLCNSAITAHFVFNLDCTMKKGEKKFTFVCVLFLKLIFWPLKKKTWKVGIMDVQNNNFSYTVILQSIFYCSQLSHCLLSDFTFHLLSILETRRNTVKQEKLLPILSLCCWKAGNSGQRRVAALWLPWKRPQHCLPLGVHTGHWRTGQSQQLTYTTNIWNLQIL